MPLFHKISDMLFKLLSLTFDTEQLLSFTLSLLSILYGSLLVHLVQIFYMVVKFIFFILITLFIKSGNLGVGPHFRENVNKRDPVR